MSSFFIGLNRTPPEIRKSLNSLQGRGAYLMYLGLDEARAASIGNLLALTKPKDADEDPLTRQFMFAPAPSWNLRAPEGKRALTVHFFTDVNDWFTFHRDESEAEAQDQQMLESCWQRMHAAIPELGDSVEVIETATPRTFYETTRRKLGMVGGVGASRNFWIDQPPYKTALPNVFAITDTLGSQMNNIEGLTRCALLLANDIAS